MSQKSSQRVARGMKRHGSRYKARRRAVDLLFEGETRDVDPVLLAQERNTLSADPDNQVAPVNAYTVTIVDGVAVNLDFLDDAIERYLTDDWELYRIPAVDRAILRLALWELVFNPEVPIKTAVVEATELASQYSGDKAASYINALLDRVSRDVASLRLEATPPPAVEVSLNDADAELLDRLVVDDDTGQDISDPDTTTPDNDAKPSIGGDAAVSSCLSTPSDTGSSPAEPEPAEGEQPSTGDDSAN